MKKIWVMILAAGVLAAVAWAQDEKTDAAAVAPAPAGKAIALVAAGRLDAGLVEWVRRYVEENSRVPARILPPVENAEGTLEEIGRRAAEGAGPDDALIIVLAAPVETSAAHGIFLPNDRVSIINVDAIKPADGNADRYKMRLGQQTLRGIGMLLGLEVCPNAQCCLSAWESLEQSDRSGHNYCPPCLMKVEKEGAAKELKVTPWAPE